MNPVTHTPPQHPDPTEGLTASAAALYRAVMTAPGQSSPALALAVGIGRSTAGKLLTSLESEGLVRRVPGGHDGTRCLPDRWHPAEAAEQPADGAPRTDEDTATTDGPIPAATTAVGLTGVSRVLFEALLEGPGDSTTHLATATGIGCSTAESVLTAMQHQGLVHHETDADAVRWTIPTVQPETTTDGEETDAPAKQADQPPADDTATVPADHAPATADLVTEPDSTATQRPDTDGPAEYQGTPNAADQTPQGGDDTAQQPAPGGAAPAVSSEGPCPTCGHVRRAPGLRVTSSGGTRLGQGQLHQLALDHLRTHPEQEWTATGIAKAIGRSSGAIANALVTMANRGEAEMTSTVPRRYRAMPQPTTVQPTSE